MRKTKESMQMQLRKGIQTQDPIIRLINSNTCHEIDYF